MAIDLNDAGSQRDFGALIPDGTFANVRMAFKVGGTSLPGFPTGDAGLFKAAKLPSDAVMLETVFTVLAGPHAKRQVFQNFTVEGGKRDEKDGSSIAWRITRQFLRAAVESALGIDPKDETPAAKAKRNLPSLSAMNGLEFAVRIGIEVDRKGVYDDKNQIAHVVTPDESEWALLKQGQIPEPRPSGARSSRVPKTSTSAALEPAWKAAAAPAQSSPAPAWQQQVAQQIPQPSGQAWPTPTATQPQPQQEPTAAPAKGPSWLTS